MRTKTSAPAKTAVAPERTWRGHITAALERMSPSYSKIAGFLLEHTTEAAFLTGVQLAHHLDLDPATIVRFAQMLGYPGYPELAAEIRASVREGLAVAPQAEAREARTPAAQWQSDLLASAEAIRNIAGVIVWKDAREFLGILRRAQAVVIVAEGPDVVLAQWLAGMLRAAGLRALSLDADLALSSALGGTLRGGDVALGVAVSASGEAVAEMLRAGAARGARTLALATSASAPAGLASEVVLVCLPARGAQAGPAPAGHTATVSFTAIAEALRRALS